MEKNTLEFLRQFNPDLVKSDEIKYAIDKWAGDKSFSNKLDQIISDRAEMLRNDDDGELYAKVYDSNPFDVESQLVGNSGCWYWTEHAIEQSYNDACDAIVEELEQGDYSEITDWLYEQDIDEDFEEWDFLIEKIIAKIKQMRG